LRVFQQPAKASAYEQGYENLRKPEISAEIERLQAERSKKTQISAERVLTELAKIGFANMADYLRPSEDGDPYLDFSQLTRDQAAALQEVTVEDFKDGRGEDGRDVCRIKFKLADKRAALADIGKHLGMFVKKVEHRGQIGGQPSDEPPKPDELARAFLAMLAHLDEERPQE